MSFGNKSGTCVVLLSVRTTFEKIGLTLAEPSIGVRPTASMNDSTFTVFMRPLAALRK